MKRTALVALILLFAIVVAVIVVRQRPIAANIDSSEEIMVDGASRHYRLVVPHSLTKPAPIVFAFHGTGDSGESMANYSGLDKLAARNGFILVYPVARRGMWATVEVNPDNIDTNIDVRYFDQLLTHLSHQSEIDRGRVYAIGMSNGATFVQLLAVARSNDLAAIAAHSGPKPLGIGSFKRPIPIMLVVGADDMAAESMQSDAKRYRSDGHDVEFISIPGLGHKWSPRHNIAIWEFLSRYSSARSH